MKDVFKLFDTDGDGVLDFNEFQRAFRAIGLKKRDGSKYDVDMEVKNERSPRLSFTLLLAFLSPPLLSPPLACQMFKSFDANGRRCSEPVMNFEHLLSASPLLPLQRP